MDLKYSILTTEVHLTHELKIKQRNYQNVIIKDHEQILFNIMVSDISIPFYQSMSCSVLKNKVNNYDF